MINAFQCLEDIIFFLGASLFLQLDDRNNFTIHYEYSFHAYLVILSHEMIYGIFSFMTLV